MNQDKFKSGTCWEEINSAGTWYYKVKKAGVDKFLPHVIANDFMNVQCILIKNDKAICVDEMPLFVSQNAEVKPITKEQFKMLWTMYHKIK